MQNYLDDRCITEMAKKWVVPTDPNVCVCVVGVVVGRRVHTEFCIKIFISESISVCVILVCSTKRSVTP